MLARDTNDPRSLSWRAALAHLMLLLAYRPPHKSGKDFPESLGRNAECFFRCAADRSPNRRTKRPIKEIFPLSANTERGFPPPWHAQSYVAVYTNEIVKSAEMGSGKSQKMCQTHGSNFELTTSMCLNPRKSSQNSTAKMYCRENSSTCHAATTRMHSPSLKSRGFRRRSLWH